MNASLQSLPSRFAEAGLSLHLLPAPMGFAGSSEIVQLDIERSRGGREERFRLFPGSSTTNRIEVQGIDKSFEQLVLLVDEPRRRFEARMARRQVEGRSDMNVVRTQGQWAWVERFTEGRKRHFLCGMDEQHCFIAQLPKPVSTVPQAHAALRPEGLTDAERQAKHQAVRQGEFFFVPLSESELKRVHQIGRGYLPVRGRGIAETARWARNGRQHLADEVWAIPTIVGGRAENLVLVRGNVRHPDHRTVCFRSWMRVFQNQEPASTPGLLWVD